MASSCLESTALIFQCFWSSSSLCVASRADFPESKENAHSDRNWSGVTYSNYLFSKLCKYPNFLIAYSKFHKIRIWQNHTCGLYIALSNRFCATRSLEGGRPQNWGYAMYPQRLMVLQKYVFAPLASRPMTHLHWSQRNTLEGPRFDLTKPQDE